jgi:hypothetical protein
MDAQLTPTRQGTGWTVAKQRAFIEHLATHGSVVDASVSVWMTARSAYHLRTRPEGAAFSAAWDMALSQAGGRLLAHAFERALKGGVRRVWKDGELAMEETSPSDRILMWLISRIGPAPFRVGTQAGTPTSSADLHLILSTLADALPDSPPLSNMDLMPETPEPPDGSTDL